MGFNTYQNICRRLDMGVPAPHLRSVDKGPASLWKIFYTGEFFFPILIVINTNKSLFKQGPIIFFFPPLPSLVWQELTFRLLLYMHMHISLF